MKLFIMQQIDVYSFGIVMWEILTGDEPYANMHYAHVIGMPYANNALQSLTMPKIPITNKIWMNFLMMNKTNSFKHHRRI